MYIKNLRMRQIRKLDELELAPGVLNTEALMLVLKKKNFSDKVDRVFKYLDAQEDSDVMAKKLYTVTTLNTSTNPYKEIKELIIPDSIIYVDGNIAGFAMPLIENHKNLGAIIKDNDKVIVSGVNLVKKAMKKRSQQDRGGISEIEAPLHISNVAIVCKKCGPTRIGYKIDGDKKIRVCRKCGEAL